MNRAGTRTSPPGRSGDGGGEEPDRIAELESELAGALEREAQARHEAGEATRAVRLLVSVLGHDLRNPLSAMIMGADSVRESAQATGHGRAMSRIVRAGQRMDRMIGQLVDVGRLRLGIGLSLQRDQHDVAALWRQVIDQVVVAHPGAEIALETEGSARGSWDAERLLQLFADLATHAVEHGEPGDRVRVEIGGSDGARVTIAVQCAWHVSPPDLATLLDPFRDDPAGGRRGGRGRGALSLGLYLGTRMVEEHGGSVAVSSSAGDGTRFVIELPR